MAKLTTVTKKELLELLKSGNFTVASHDYGQVSIYKGKHNGYNSNGEEPEFPAKEVKSFELGDAYGYMQDIVSIFAEALGGNNGGSA